VTRGGKEEKEHGGRPHGESSTPEKRNHSKKGENGSGANNSKAGGRNQRPVNNVGKKAPMGGALRRGGAERGRD